MSQTWLPPWEKVLGCTKRDGWGNKYQATWRGEEYDEYEKKAEKIGVG